MNLSGRPWSGPKRLPISRPERAWGGDAVSVAPAGVAAC